MWFAKQVVWSEEFQSMEPADRFNHLLGQLKAARKAPRKSAQRKTESASWTPEDNMLTASFRNTGKTFNLALKSKNAGEFGQFISSNLESLYRAFKEAKVRSETGD